MDVIEVMMIIVEGREGEEGGRGSGRGELGESCTCLHCS